MKRIPMIDEDEYDALTRWKRFYKWRPGQRAKIKRRYRRRERRQGRWRGSRLPKPAGSGPG